MGGARLNGTLVEGLEEENFSFPSMIDVIASSMFTSAYIGGDIGVKCSTFFTAVTIEAHWSFI